MLHLDSRHYIMTSSDELLARMFSLDDERHQRVYCGQPEVAQIELLNEQHGNENKAVLKKGSNRKKFEPGGEERNDRDPLVKSVSDDTGTSHEGDEETAKASETKAELEDNERENLVR